MTGFRKMLRAGLGVMGVMVIAAVIVVVPMQSPASAFIAACMPGEVFCSPMQPIQITPADPCTDKDIHSPFMVPCGIGTPDLTTPEGAAAAREADPNSKAAMEGFTQTAQSWAAAMATFIFVDELGGGNTYSSPILNCPQAQGAQAEACKTDSRPWFLDQFKLMRSVTIYLVIPLFFLMIIQSIAKGSLHMLLKGALIMLPLSLLGTVVIVVFMQQLLNISDDLSNYIAAKTITGSEVTCKSVAGANITVRTCNLTNSIVEDSVGGSNGFVALIWALLFILASMVIWLELVARQIGVYMMTLLMPLAFAGIIWSRSIAIAKKLITYEIALIFTKPFIAAAVSLGMAALDHSNFTSADGASNGGPQGIIVGTFILLMAAFSATKVVMISPAAGAGAQQLINKNAVFSRGQGVKVAQLRTAQYVRFMRRGV